MILHDGSLLAVSSEIPDQPLTPAETCATGPTTILARRSTDLGAHWLAPVQIPEPDPDNALTWSAAAVAPDGTVYVAWQHTYAGPDGPRLQIRYSQSADNGATWTSRPGIVADGPGGPELGSTSLTTTGGRCSSIWAAPSVAVTPDGTLGIGYFDHRNDRPIHEPGSVTDYWLSYSHDRGATWATQHVAGPFDQTQAPSEDGATAEDGTNGPGFLGDYQGITALKGGFGVSLALAQPLSGAAFSLKYPPTDVFYGFVPVDS